ncbi:hypothetical protein [Pseudoponticoccus marisrubri]|uniref:Uncharacterized protein n=1 Tax=Pseudoponticoccus marisrubri TaxID=1685382 RepID=A0A0W7WNV5_9RHOB|nr:hypothetical protein [Pseudoponticoccus marisrubri]KUF12272.1 hypothetical protein AVJ23_00615 [Pseudoponticoccus marisrubri]
MPKTKIATCCYCGTRAALVLKGRERHELSCASCGAPLHEMKHLRSDAVDREARHHDTVSHVARRVESALDRRALKGKKAKKGKKKKSPARKLFGEAFDLIEDIFD